MVCLVSVCVVWLVGGIWDGSYGFIVRCNGFC